MLFSRHSLAAAGLALLAIGLGGCSKTDTAPSTASTAPSVAVAPAPLPASQPALQGAALPAKLCGVLRTMAPELKGMPAVGARAQLVMAIATAFDSSAVALGTVSSEIDAIATSECPEVRQPLLAATKAASLQEAVR